MSSNRGFSLPETLIATVVLVTGLLAVASLFSYSIRTNMYTEQMTTGILLANTKMEGLRATGMAGLTAGGGLNSASPTANYFEYVSISTSGALTTDTVTTTAPYLTLWMISDANPVIITVAVYAQRGGVSGQMAELIRTTTSLTSGF